MINRIILIYQRFFSPVHHFVGKTFFGASYACRFSPTCSEYAATAIRKYGIIHGSVLGLKRLLRCHPFSSSHYLDPVP